MDLPIPLWRVSFNAPNAHHEIFEDLLEPYCLTLSTFEDEKSNEWKIEGLIPAEPDIIDIQKKLEYFAQKYNVSTPKPTFDLVPSKNWLAENLIDFPPIKIGRYYVYGSHIQPTAVGGMTRLELNSGSAFGSGEHATTEGCLLAMEYLAHQFDFKKILDMGCGSGILTMAAVKTWRKPAIASDIDDEAIRVTRENAKKNGLKGLIRTTCGMGYSSKLVRNNGPYDLILCNILANPLVQMASDLSHHLDNNPNHSKFVILSGLLERDGNRVIAAHQAQGLHLYKKIKINGWVVLVMTR
jgi:ribosomal protein L11 methyltransferase